MIHSKMHFFVFVILTLLKPLAFASIENWPKETCHELVQKLTVNRCGDVPGSQMRTKSLEMLVQPDAVYEFNLENGITQVCSETETSPVRNFESQDSHLSPDFPYLRLSGIWDHAGVGPQDDSNILGGNGSLHVYAPQGVLHVPVIEATEETLSYFRAHLLKPGDRFRFQSKRPFPIFTMEIGEQYIPEYIMKKGNGLYLEYHDEPHFHQPMDPSAGGVYLLAKKVGTENSLEIFHMTAFRIPYGTAVYSEPGAIHDDAPTQGNWRVGYIDAQNFSTVILRDTQNQPIRLKFDGGS